MVIRTLNNTDSKPEMKIKVIRNNRLTRQILNEARERGIKLYIPDVKPDREDPDHKRCVHCFEDNDEFQEVFSAVLEKNRASRKSEDADLRKQIADMQKKIDELTKNNEAKE